MIRLYGVTQGNGSWARVTAGCREALSALGLLSGFFDLARIEDPDDHCFDEGYDAPIGITIGPPLAAGAMRGRGRHEQRWVMIATNSSWLPRTVMDQVANMVDGFIGTSTWASQVIRRHVEDLVELPVVTWRHGISDAFQPREDIDPQGTFSVLHLSSTRGQRKGTSELVAGWNEAMLKGWLPKGSRLHLVIDGGGTLRSIAGIDLTSMVADSIVIVPRLDLSEPQMSRFYCCYHLVAQPSRAEGFGLVPLEARASGVPVLATACTGHEDHFFSNEGCLVVANGPPAPIDDGPGASAPTVSGRAIAECLREAYENRVTLRQQAADAAAAVRRGWSWKLQTDQFWRRLRSLAEPVQPELT